MTGVAYSMLPNAESSDSLTNSAIRGRMLAQRKGCLIIFFCILLIKVQATDLILQATHAYQFCHRDWLFLSVMMFPNGNDGSLNVM